MTKKEKELIKSLEQVYMAIETGSVDTLAGWGYDEPDFDGVQLTPVVWDAIQECWVDGEK